LSLLGVFVWRSKRAKRGWRNILTMIYCNGLFCWFFFGLWNPAYIHARTILWFSLDGSILLGATFNGYFFDRHHSGWKMYVFTYTMLCIVFYFNAYVIPLFLLDEAFLRSYVLLFPVFITMYEVVFVRGISRMRWFRGVDPRAVIMISKFMLATFQTYNYTVIIYTYKDENRGLFVANLCMSAVANICSRSRILQKGVVTIYNHVNKAHVGENYQPYILHERNYFERNYYGMKYEIEYIPLCCILLIRLFDWVPLFEYGNHLNAYGKPDPDFYLPLWLYIAFLTEAIISDITVYILAKRAKEVARQDHQVPYIRNLKWAVLCYFVVIGETAGTILNQSAGLATYKLETNI